MGTTGTGSLALRPITEQEWDEVAGLMDLVFSDSGATPEQRADERSIFEIERSLAAFDDDLVCGHTAAYSLEMTVPGGHQIPVAGVTWVGVRPTYRRRGLLRRLMFRQLEDVHANGTEAVAALYASEAVIYGRYGYGLASHAVDVTIPRSATALAGAPADDSLRLRLLPPEDSLALLEPVCAALVPTRPGMLARDKVWAQHRIFDPETWRKGATPLRCLVAENASGVRGYAWFSTLGRWEGSRPDGVVQVREVGAHDPAAYAAVWRLLLDLDLMATVEARLPVDDALLHMLDDMRSARPTVKDQLFIRLVDVGKALAARGYAADVDVVFQVTDDFCPWNTGQWRLAAGPEGAVCEPTDAAADLALTARELGAAYLGGVSLSALAHAGRVSELRNGALAAASRAFASDVQPFCAYTF